MGLGFEGSDHQSNYHMTEAEVRRENWEQSKLLIILGIFMAFCLVLSIYLHVQEIIFMVNAKSVVVNYESDENTVKIKDDQGKSHSVSVTDTVVSHPNNKITIYYQGDNFDKAKPVTALWFWLVMYFVWGSLFALCVRSVYRNLHRNKKASVKI